MDLEKKFVQSLPAENKKWLAYAIAGMITSDGVVDESELDALRHAVEFLESVEEINQLIALVKAKQRPTLEIVKGLDRKIATRMLINLSLVAVADDKLKKTEVDFFKYAGTKLGFEQEYAQSLLNWSLDLLAVKVKRVALQKQGERLPLYIEVTPKV